MGFINLITIGDYVKKSEKYIYEKYGIKKEELQTMQEDDFQQLIVKIIKKYINIDYCIDGSYGWRLAKTYRGEEIDYVDGIDKYSSYISKRYEEVKEGEKEVFFKEIETNLLKVIECAYSFIQYDIWCDFYMILKYTKIKNKKYDPYENGAYFSDVKNDDLPFSSDDTDSLFPIYAREFQRNLYNDKIKIFSKLYDNKLDVTRYGIRKTESIIDLIERSLDEKEEDKKIEELLVMDKIMGISLTNTMFWNTKDADKDKWNDIVEISKKLGCMDSIVVSKLLGDIICVYMQATNYDVEIINELKRFFDSNMECFNLCFNDLKRIFLISTYDEKEQENISFLLEDLLSRTGHLISEGKTPKYRFYKMDEISDFLKGDNRIRISKRKVNMHELYACIHRAVIQGIVETNKGSAKK